MATWFANFEDGTLTTEFDTVVSGGGDLSAHADAARKGVYGMRAVVNSTDAIYVQWGDQNIYELRIGLYFHPNSYSVTTDTLYILGGGTILGNADYRLYLRWTGSNHQVCYWLTTDGDSITGSYVNILNDWNWIELHMKRSSGINDGFIKLWINTDVTGTPTTQNLDIDDDTQDYDYMNFGVESISIGTTATLYFDYICANDTGDPIGSPPDVSERGIMRGVLRGVYRGK